MLDGRKKTFILVSACLIAVFVIGILAVSTAPSVHKKTAEIDDMTPLADMLMDDPTLLDEDALIVKLDGMDGSEDNGTIVIRFTNRDSGEKFLLNFDKENAYQLDVAQLISPGDYKLKIIERGKVDRLKLDEKKITISESDKLVLVKFK